jgi:hypothetical protein
MKHLPLSEREVQVIREKIESDIEKSNREWHCTELIDQLCKTNPGLAHRCSIYIMDAILSASRRLVRIKKFTWASSKRDFRIA